MYKIFIFHLALYFLIGCNKENTETYSPTLQITWNNPSGYSFNLFSSSQENDTSVLGNYSPISDTLPAMYKWENKDIQLTGMALWKKAIDYGYSLKVNSTGAAYLYKNDKPVSLNQQDILIASPLEVTKGSAKAQLNFKHGMSKVIVIIEQTQAIGYTFSINLQTISTEGYIDLSQGKIISPQSTSAPTETLYFAQEEDSNYYSNYLIPQVLPENATINIMGMKEIGEKVLSIKQKVPLQHLKAGKQYKWKFSASHEQIVFEDFTEEDWEV